MPEEPILPDVELPEPPDTPVCQICGSDNQEGMEQVYNYPRCRSCMNNLECNECQRQIYSPDEARTMDNGDQYCDECAFYCDSHEGYEIGTSNETTSGVIICEECSSENYTICDGCELYAYYDDVFRVISQPGQDRDGADTFCNSCFENGDPRVYNSILEIYTPQPTELDMARVVVSINFHQIRNAGLTGQTIRIPGPIPNEFLRYEEINLPFLRAEGIEITNACRNNHTTTSRAQREGSEGYCRHCCEAFTVMRDHGVAETKEAMPSYTKITSYHSHTYSDKDFLYMAKDKNENNTMYFGIELETAFSSDHISGEPGERRASRVLAELKGTFVGERDGTVSNGAELISKPLTYEYLTSKTMLKRLQKALSLMDDLGAINGHHNGIGLHVHVSRMPFQSETKATVEMEDDMNWFINCFKPYVEVLSRRKATSYCKYPIEQIQKPAHASRMYVDKKVLTKGSHGYALNLMQSRTPTYEFRVFNSTKNLEQLIASVEFVRNLSLFVINEPTIIGKTFRDIVMYKPTKYLSKYVNKLALQYPEQMKGWKTVRLKSELEVK